MQQVGPYVLEAELGRGGMGVVWRAHDPALDRTVAVKVLLHPLAAGAELERFRREAQAQARLRHPSIAGVHACGTTQAGQPYLVLDHIEGQSLATRLRAGPLPVAEASRLVATLARAVAYAHGRGVLHRDLKARNVMLAVDGDPVLLDFGLAAVTGAGRLTATGEAMGTPGCLAPEQALGDRERIGPKTDVYGLGVVLHEALTGSPPFEGGEVLKLLADVVERPAAPPSRARPGLDPRLDAIVLRCLEKDPARRWPTALALADALDELTRPTPPARRRSGPAVALVAAACVGAWAIVRDPGPAAPERPAPSVGAVPSSAVVDAARFEELASDLVRAARDALGRGDARAALADLDRAVALSPTVEAVSARALVHVALGDQEGARRDLLDLARREEPGALVHAARGLTLTNEPEALEVAERAVEATGGRSGQALAARALARALRKDAPGAAADAAAALRLEPQEPLALLAEGAAAPDRVDAYEHAAELAARAGDPLARAAALTALASARVPALMTADDASLTAALAELDEALRLAPALRQALLQRASFRIALASGDLDQGLADAAQLVRLQGGRDPTAIELLVYLRARRALDPARGLDRAEADRALADLGGGLDQRPGDAALLEARAELRVALGDLVGAESDAQAALRAEEAPGSADRATALLARLRGRRGATDDGLALVNAFIERPGVRAPHCLAERALLLVQRGDAQAAAADAQRALALERTLVRGHYARARALALSGAPADLEQAKRALQEAVRLSPGFAQARGDLALVRATLGELRTAQALRALQEARALQPWAPEHPCNEALLAELAGDQAATDAALERALALDPAYLPARLHRGQRRLSADARAALADLQLVVERQPGAGDAWALLAVARHRLQDADGALLAVSQALSAGSALRPLSRATALRLRAGIRLARGEAAGALADASLAVTLDPASSEGWWYRGRARAATGDPGALADLDAALERSPENVDCRLDRAELLLRGDPPARDGARAELERLLEGLPEGAQRRRAQALLGREGAR